MAARDKEKGGWAPFLGALALGALGQVLVWRPDSEWGRTIGSHSLAMPLGWLAFLAGGLLLVRSWRRTQGEIAVQQGPRRVPRSLELGLLLLILAGSAGVRLHDLKGFPMGGFRDEGENGNVAIQIMNNEMVEGTGTRLPVYIEMHTQNATGYFYPVAVFFKLFGVSITSVRYVSVFFGVLSIAALYFLLRWLFGAPLGLVLAACLCLLRWHINFSRIGFLGMMTLFLEIPVFYFLLRGLKERAGPALNKFKPGAFGLAVALTLLRGALSLVPGLASVENWVGLAMGVPLLVFAWKARKDPRSRDLMLAALALALAMYSYIAARLIVMIVGLVVLRAVLAAPGVLDKKRSRQFTLCFFAGLLGLLLLTQGSAHAALGLKMAGKLVLLAAAVWAGVALFSLRAAFKEWLKPLGLALGLGLVVAGPLFGYTLAHWSEINARSDRVSIFNDVEADKRPWGTKLMEEIPQTLGMTNVRGDGNPRHNLPGEVMLNPWWAAFFGLAMFYCLFRWKDERVWLVLSWWQVSLLAGYLSIEAPQAYRTIGAIPAILIGMGLVLERGLVAARRRYGRDWGFAVWPLLLLMLVLGGFYELQTYFKRQPLNAGVWAEFSTAEYLMGRDVQAMQLEQPTRALLRPDWADSYTFRFMTYPDRNYEYFELARHIPLKADAVPEGQRAVFVLGPSQAPLKGVLADTYPHGIYHEQRHKITGELLYWTYLVSADEIKAASTQKGGLKAVYYQDTPLDLKRPQDGPHWVPENKRKEQVDPFLLFDWAVSPVPGFFSAEWKGWLVAPKAGPYMFWINSNSYGDLELDGKRVVLQPFEPDVRSAMAEGRVSLSAGRHRIRVRYYEGRNYSRMELWWQEPGGRKEVVPSQALIPE